MMLYVGAMAVRVYSLTGDPYRHPRNNSLITTLHAGVVKLADTAALEAAE